MQVYQFRPQVPALNNLRYVGKIRAIMPISKSLIPVARIEKSILLIRDHKVMLDADLAALYGVETKVLVRAVKRNMGRFPSHFMFQLSKEEFDNLRLQFGTSSCRFHLQ